MYGAFTAVKVLLMVLASIAVPVLIVFLLYKGLQFIGFLVRMLSWLLTALAARTVAFVRATITDAMRALGALLAAALVLPLAVVHFLFGRWRSGLHYGHALEDELGLFALATYRLVLGNPIRLLGLDALTEGIERRVPRVVASAPKPRRRSVQDPERFDGYRVVGTLEAGGSGARLFLARPTPEKLAGLRAAGHENPGEVVIKSFALETGSTLPQIVRESRALEAASRLGLVLEHELTEERFFYVMPFVPGERLDVVIERLHAASGPEGLGPREFDLVLGYAADLLHTLERFHHEGLWHKDIKPSNLIVSKGRVHLVDLGLVTPLASALTLTTHGTEYFRDPEMVRLALQGVKVHEVDGVKFDIYSAGAVLYAMVENSFPAQGSLSRVTKRCPQALQWILRRAMADLSTRYTSAAEMLADLSTLLAAADPFAVRPADLPSVRGGQDADAPQAASVRADPAQAAPPPAAASTHQLTAPNRVHRRVGRALLAAGLLGVLLHGSARRILGSSSGASPAGPIDLARAHDPVPSATDTQAAASERLRIAQQLRRYRACVDFWHEQLGTITPGRAGAERILILDDLSPRQDPYLCEALAEELARRGFVVLGAGLPGASEEAMVSLLARARIAAGVADPTDGDAARRLAELAASEPGLDRVLWLASGSEPDTLCFRLVNPEGTAAVSPVRLAALERR